MKTAFAAAAVFAALALGACNRNDEAQPEPQGEVTGAAMPDTSAPRTDDPTLTAPDAGATGTVPATGAPPPVAPTPPAS